MWTDQGLGGGANLAAGKQAGAVLTWDVTSNGPKRIGSDGLVVIFRDQKPFVVLAMNPTALVGMAISNGQWCSSGLAWY